MLCAALPTLSQSQMEGGGPAQHQLREELGTLYHPGKSKPTAVSDGLAQPRVRSGRGMGAL